MSARTWSAEAVAEATSARPTGEGKWQGHCPAHEDRTSSLSITEGGDGKLLLKCHARCTFDAIITALNSGNGSAPSAAAPERMTEECTYDYVDENGTLLYQVVRYKPKDFRPRRPNVGRDPGEPPWIYNLDGVRRVLYHLPDVVAAVAMGSRIYVVEGEKDVLTLHAQGLIATTAAQGAASPWLPEYTEQIARCPDVVIIPDKDAAGEKRALTVAREIHPAVGAVRIVRLPGGYKSDVTDWFAAGGSKDALEVLANTTPTLTADGVTEVEASLPGPEPAAQPEGAPPDRWIPLDFEAIERDGVPPIDWLFTGWIARLDIFMIAGDATVGKSTTLSRMAYAAASGGEWVGIPVARKLRVLYIDEEQSESEVYQMFRKHGPRLPATDLHVFVGQGANLDSDEGLAIVEREVADCRPDLICIDSATAAFGSAEGNNNTAIAGVFARMRHLRSTYGCTIGYLHHLGKPGETKRSMMHRVLGAVAYVNQSSATFVAIARGSDSLEFHSLKRRGIPKPYPTMIIGYREDQDGRCYLENLGQVEDDAGAVSGCTEWVVEYLRGLDSPSKRADIVEVAGRLETPYTSNVVDKALKHGVKLGVLARPRQGYYAAKGGRDDA